MMAFAGVGTYLILLVVIGKAKVRPHPPVVDLGRAASESQTDHVCLLYELRQSEGEAAVCGRGGALNTATPHKKLTNTASPQKR